MIENKKYTTKDKILRVFFILCLLPVLVYTGWCGYTIYNLAQERAVLKKDYSEVNNIKYGILSVDKWRDNILEIINIQIEEFEFSDNQQDTLKSEINKILNALITQADEVINEKQKHVGGKLKKFAFNALINVDKVRERVPEFSQTIIDEINKPRNKQKLKFLARDKLYDFAGQMGDTVVTINKYDKTLMKYNVTQWEDFNYLVAERAAALQQRSYNITFIMISVIIFFLLLWFVVKTKAVLFTPLFVISALLAMVFLFIGIAAPMIEIDARIQKINFMLIGKDIQFLDQVIFYQSKSILDVVKILITTGKTDSIFVGFLLLVFSIVFPLSKLISTKIYLLGTTNLRNNKIIKFFVFKSGKWSMADVMVVAIFMAYIGFKGILDGEFAKMNVDMNNEFVASIATNKTALQPGFILFISFVLFGLILSSILKRIFPYKKSIPVTETQPQ